jgi:hypothetical protein
MDLLDSTPRAEHFRTPRQNVLAKVRPSLLQIDERELIPSGPAGKFRDETHRKTKVNEKKRKLSLQSFVYPGRLTNGRSERATEREG